MARAILLAEDEPNIAKLIVFKLGREGFEVTHAHQGQEAIDLLPTQSWSLIILDVMMPVCDGWTVLKTVRESEAFQKIPVLMLTAKNLADDLASASLLGASRVLRKPFDPAHLAFVVGQMVGGSLSDSDARSPTEDSDPERIQLRKEYLESLPQRLEALLSCRSPADAQEIAHRIGGSAKNCGLGRLGHVAGLLDDLLALPPSTIPDQALLVSLAALLGEALRATIESGTDPITLLESAEAERIISVAERLVDGASLGSS